MPRSLVSCLVDGTKGFFGDGGFLEMEQRVFFPAGGPIVVFFAAVPG